MTPDPRQPAHPKAHLGEGRRSLMVGVRTPAAAAMLLAATMSAALHAAPSQDATACPSRWLDTGFVPGITNLVAGLQLNATVSAMIVDESTEPPSLIVAGSFREVFGTPMRGVARWDGQTWTPFGEGLSGTVRALALLPPPDGRGPAELFAAGTFTTSGNGAPLNRIARWTGANWAPLGEGLLGEVRALCVFDDGTGPSLYAGGFFTTAGGAPANRIARWDGQAWHAVGSWPGGGGMDQEVNALIVHDDGTGSRLYAGGSFDVVDGHQISKVAAWDGASWAGVGSVGPLLHVHCFEPFDAGEGLRLFAGGRSAQSCCATQGRVWSWDGSTWSELPGQFTGNALGTVLALHGAVFDGAPRLLAGGEFTSVGPAWRFYCARWTGSGWASIGEATAPVRCFADFSQGDDSQPAVHMGGSFIRAGSLLAEAVARRSSARWERVGPHPSGLAANGTIYDAVETTVDGEAVTLLAGFFTAAGGGEAGPVAIWRDGRLEALGQAPAGVAYSLLLSRFEPGVVYAAGTFEDHDGLPHTSWGMIRWDGSTWTPLAPLQLETALSPNGLDLIEYEDQLGKSIILAGTFNKIGGTPMNGLARFDGATWSDFSPQQIDSPQFWALIEYDSGNGPELYASGGGWGALFRRAGSTWLLAAFFNPNPLSCLAVFDDGTGSKLYAADHGGFLHRWDGATKQTLASIGTTRRRMHVHDFGEGPRLLISGRQAGAAPGVAIWDGNAIASLPGTFHLLSSLSADGEVWAMASQPGGRLLVGGTFRWLVQDETARPMAHLAVFDSSPAPWIINSPSDRVAFLGEAVDFSVGTFDDLSGVVEQTYQWRLDGVPLADGPRVIGSDSPVLLLLGVAPEDAGDYDVLVSNDCGTTASAPATLVVTCPGDGNGDGVIGGEDLGALLGAWGSSEDTFDLNGDGTVDGADLGLLVAGWGKCRQR